MRHAADTGRFLAVRVADRAAVREAADQHRQAARDAATSSERSLALQRAALAQALDALERRSLRGRGRALVVDDDAHGGPGLARVLVAGCWSVELSRTGAGALERLIGGAYEVVVVDLLLPGEVGGETVATRARERGARVVLVSGLAADALERAAALVGAHAALAKPIAPDALLAACRPPETIRAVDP